MSEWAKRMASTRAKLETSRAALVAIVAEIARLEQQAEDERKQWLAEQTFIAESRCVPAIGGPFVGGKGKRLPDEVVVRANGLRSCDPAMVDRSWGKTKQFVTPGTFTIVDENPKAE